MFVFALQRGWFINLNKTIGHTHKQLMLSLRKIANEALNIHIYVCKKFWSMVHGTLCYNEIN